MSAKQLLLFVSFILTTNLCLSQFFDNKPLYVVNIQTFNAYDNAYIKNVSLANCQIRAIDRNSFSQMVRLLAVRLDHNELSNIHENMFDSNVKLEHLNLAWNKFQTLPPYIFSKLTSLKELSLYKNNIKYLDLNTFSNLRSLTKLMIYSNGLSQLDANIFRNNINLEYLHFGDNFIENLHETIFNNMPNLDSLMFHRNRVNYLPKKIFSRLPNLKDISMAFNAISDLDSAVFENNIRLENVWLSGNKLTTLNKGLFKNAGNLKFLNLNSNKIKNIESDVLPVNSKLQKLYLSNNSLSTTDSAIITNLNDLTILTIDSNPWFCNCAVKELHNKWKNLNSQPSPICSEPPNLKDRLWSNLNSNDFKCTNIPKIINSKLDINGDKATIGCQIDSTADVEKISWKLGDNTLVSDRFKTLNKPYKICQSTSADGSTWHNLIIDDLKTGDSGKYKCSFGDKYSNTEKEENLIVTPNQLRSFNKPTLSLTLNKDLQILADFGETISAGCQIFSRSIQKPNVLWTFNNQPIDGSSRSSGGLQYKIVESSIDDHVGWYNLTILSVRDDDSGIYACQANGYDEVNKFTLKVNKKLNTYIQGWTDYE